MKFRQGDEILIIKGKDKGRRGKIEKIFPKDKSVLISGLNIFKKHVKKIGDQKGGIVEIARPLPVASVALICPKCGKNTRIGIKILADGSKVRICKKCKEILDNKEKQK